MQGEAHMTDVDMTILAVSGSLREGSFNSRLVRQAVELAPSGVLVEVYDRLRDIPPYDQDDDGEDVPEPVADLRRRIRHADGLLILTPEYNYSLPGQLKNAIDWMSRPFGQSPLARKPVAIGGASTTGFGTVRAQLALRQTLLWTDSRLVVKPELHLAKAHEKFDSSGELADEAARMMLGDLVAALAGLITEQRKLAVDLP
ncbi:NADPH-dependent FMN reductase [Kitasatospora azatica]|uniref:NADPH-dependent FMN reductase n=1 Tax=Kitasatospora azatica TaxID=58347 RepID=UPI001E5100C9|nr:NADPH-dependent FMN reductase [Kitasatospora azatica]